MEENIQSQTSPQFVSASTDVSAARMVAQQALAFYDGQRRQMQGTGTQGFFTIIGSLMALTSGMISVAGALTGSPSQSERIVTTLHIRNWTRFHLVIMNSFASDSRVAPSPMILPGETIDFPFTSRGATRFDGQDWLQLGLVPLPSGDTVNIRIRIRDDGQSVRVNAVTFNSALAEDRISGQPHHTSVDNIFYRGVVGSRDIMIVPSRITNSINSTLDITVISPS